MLAEKLAIHNIEDGVPYSVTLMVTNDTLEAGAALAEFLRLPDINSGIEECIKTAYRFHTVFPTARAFITRSHDDKSQSLLDELYTCELTPLSPESLNWMVTAESIRIPRSKKMNGDLELLIEVPKNVAEHLALLAISNFKTLEETMSIYIREGLLMQAALTGGGKVLLVSNYDTGATVISIKEQALLFAHRFIPNDHLA